MTLSVTDIRSFRYTIKELHDGVPTSCGWEPLCDDPFTHLLRV